MTILEDAKHAIGLDSGPGSSSGTGATRAEMSQAKLPIAYRDSCAGLLIKLNECRRKEWYMQWKCVDERHGYEKCQYQDYLRRVDQQTEIRKQKAEAAAEAAKQT